MTVEWRLRPAVLGDLEDMWAIEKSVFGTDAWSRELLRDELTAEHRTYLVAVGASIDGRAQPEDWTIVGYGGLLAVGTEGDIQTIALTPEARGVGLGRRLMQALLAEAVTRGVRTVFLEVRGDNRSARSLYDSLGFVEIGVRPKYYQPDGVDAVVMRQEMEDRR